MNMLKTSLVTLGGVFFLIGAIALVSPQASQGDSMRDVKVVNTTSEPVPTVAQGTTNVAGNVGINPSSNVVKIDSSANIVKVENSASPLLVHVVGVSPVRQAVVHRGVQTLPTGQFEVTVPSFVVPEGKRWVIEYINFQVNAPEDFHATLTLMAPPPFGSGLGLVRYHLLAGTKETPVGINISQQVKIYVYPGQTQLKFQRGHADGPETIFNFVFSGYLETIE